MALFDAEKIFRNLVAAMGVTPEQITSLIVEVVTEVRTIRAEREAFKAASAKVVPDVLARLTRLEDTCERLDDMLHAIRCVVDPSYTKEPDHAGNEHDRDHVNGSGRIDPGGG